MKMTHHRVQMMRDKTRDQVLQMLLSVLLTAQDQPSMKECWWMLMHLFISSSHMPFYIQHIVIPVFYIFL